MKNSKFLTYSAAIAGIYAVLTIVLSPISYGIVQVRVSEALTVLAGMMTSAIPGLFVGCLIANIFTGNIIDIIFGSLTTLAAAFISYKLKDKPYLVPLPPVILNAVIVGTYLYYQFGINDGVSIWYSIGTVGLGELAACYVIGLPLLLFLKKKFPGLK